MLASWVSSRNVLRYTMTYNAAGFPNLLRGPGGPVEASAAKFVLQTRDIVTLSGRILISVPPTLLFPFIIQKTWVGCYRLYNSGKRLRKMVEKMELPC